MLSWRPFPLFPFSNIFLTHVLGISYTHIRLDLLYLCSSSYLFLYGGEICFNNGNFSVKRFVHVESFVPARKDA